MGVGKRLPLKQKHGDMPVFCVYFEGKVSNDLLQENCGAVISAFVSMIIRKNCVVNFFNNSIKDIVICSNLPLLFHRNGHCLLLKGIFYLLQSKKNTHSLMTTQPDSLYITTALLNIFQNHYKRSPIAKNLKR